MQAAATRGPRPETWSTSLAATTRILTLGDRPYLLHPAPAACLGPLRTGRRFVPATYLGAVTRSGLDDVLARCHTDDVWTTNFLSLVIHSQRDEAEAEAVAQALRERRHRGPEGEDEDEDEDADAAPRPPLRVGHGLALAAPGPYVLDAATGDVHAVYRLHADANHAFVRGAVPAGAAAYQWLAASDLVPVPSRLYSAAPSVRKPLAGLRFGVKDNLDVAGLETGHGSRCYRDFYPPRAATAPCVQELLDAGAVLVGKLRCCQWGDGQDPVDRLEEVTPTNPRGDGFQKPSGSSSGSAAACASYPWLDFTLGTDTGGSIRHPAAVNGVYGLRPSGGRVVGVAAAAAAAARPPGLDEDDDNDEEDDFATPGVLARAPAVAAAATRVLLGSSSSSPPPSPSPPPPAVAPKTTRFQLLYAVEAADTAPGAPPKFFPREPPPPGSAGAVAEAFVARLEAHLGGRRRAVSVADLWARTRPADAGADLAAATARIYQDTVYPALWHGTVAPFARAYAAAAAARGTGARPFVEPSTRARLDYGAAVPAAARAAAARDRRVFARWVRRVLLPSPPAPRQSDDDDDDDDPEAQTVPLLVYPQSWGRPSYRDEPAAREPGQLFWPGFSVYSLSYCSGCPDYVVPVGEVAFTSRLTGQRAFLPVAVSLLVPRGMDDVLLGLLQDLEAAGILRPVACGSCTFGDAGEPGEGPL